MSRFLTFGLGLFAACALARADLAQITVDPSKIIAPVSPYLTGVCMEDVNHEIYGGIYDQMIFGESFQEPEGKCWTPYEIGTLGGSPGRYELTHDNPFIGTQSQRIVLDGQGEAGLENSGLNGHGIHFNKDQRYLVDLWARSSKQVRIRFELETWSEGGISGTAAVKPGGWQHITFALTANVTGHYGRVYVSLIGPGDLDLGYVYVRPAPTERRFGHLPIRTDVADKLVEQGVTVMRYGGSMINAPEYRWKKMTGPREKRPPYKGTWYPFSSNGWGIPDFCAFTDAAGFLGIPAFNMDETPQDMADFIQYAHGSSSTKWGAQRIADGYKEPFKTHILELGNEEKVNDNYWKKFEPIARAIWSKDPKTILTVGDFHYDQVITDPFHFSGGEVDTLAAHQKILALAKEYGAEVWFDVHLNTQEIPPPNAIDPLLSYIHALTGLSAGAKFHVVTYELNADRHDLTRALANAKMIGMIERAGAEPVVTSANALQVDGQNDNGWNQGLIFMNPEKVWVQPPGYVMQMISRARLKNVVQAVCDDSNLDVTATSSEDGKTIALQVVNVGATPVRATLNLPDIDSMQAWTLAGDLNAVNTADKPEAIVPTGSESHWELLTVVGGRRPPPIQNFPPHSFTVMRFPIMRSHGPQ